MFESDLVMPNYVMENFEVAEVWNAQEAKNKRKDATVGREFVMSLPHLLPAHERVEIAGKAAQEISDTYGVAATFAVHRGPEGRNWHTHILVSANSINPDGTFGPKVKDLDPKDCKFAGKPNPAEVWRKRLSEIQNEFLDEAKLPPTDHRSYQERKIDRIAQIKMGKEAWNLEKKGFETRKGNINRAIAEMNQIKQERSELAQEQRELRADMHRSQLERVMNSRKPKPVPTTKDQREKDKAIENMTNAIKALNPFAKSEQDYYDELDMIQEEFDRLEQERQQLQEAIAYERFLNRERFKELRTQRPQERNHISGMGM